MIERYCLSPMRELWTPAAQYKRWLDVELAALAAMEELGGIPAGSRAAVEEKVNVDIPRIREIEEETGHDLLAFIRSLEEQAGDPGRFIHHGLTSSDVKDTALSLRINDSLNILLKEAVGLVDLLREKARRYEGLVIVGRTHGRHAEPTTLGLKFFIWHDELIRDIERLRRAKETICVGKLSGPVGTYSMIDPRVEGLACRRLGLAPARVASQILQRDRHAEVMAATALTGTTLEKIALEIRHLSRSEVEEVEEPAPQGSSSMPHKRNPIISERICGLARVLRGNLQAAFEDNALWHERDMSHSGVERIIFPDSLILLHYMLVKVRGLIDGLGVNPERISENLKMSSGAIYSQSLLIALIEHGMSRSLAHEVVEAAAQRAREAGTTFISALNGDPRVADVLKGAPLDEESILSRLRATSRRIIEQEG